MVGNVTGVSLLETVGVPASPQTAAGTVPGKNFAAVMQQAGNEAGTSLPGSLSGVNGAQEKEQATEQGGARGATSANAAPSAQSDVLKADTPSATGRRGQAAGKAGAGQQVNIAFAKRPESAAIQDVPGPVPAASLGKATGVRADGAVVLPVVTAEENEAAVVKPDVLVAEAAAPADLPALSQGTGKGAVSLQPVSVPQKSGKETISLESKPVAKPIGAKGDSQLTALIPQGMAVVPQNDASVSTVNAMAAVVVPVLPVLVEAAPLEAKDVGDALAAGDVRGSVSLPGTPAETAARAGFAKVMAQTTAAPVAAKGPVQVDANASTKSVPQEGEPAKAGAVALEKRSGGAMQDVPSEQAVDVVPASLVQRQPLPKDGALEATTVSAQPVVAGAGVAMTGAMKQTVSATLKKIMGSAKSAGEAVSETVVAGPLQAETTPSSSKAVPATAPVVKPLAAPVVSDVTARTPAAKTADAPPVPVRNAASQSKPAAEPDGLSATPAANKETGSSSAAVSGQPAVFPVDHAGAVASVAVPVISPSNLSPVQTTASSAVSGGHVTESVSAAGATGMASGASLPHTTLSATPTSLEVGVSSGTHGWLKIRAELNAAGEVNASLTGTSSAAAEKLRGDLPALSSFLQAEKVPVGVLDVRSAVHTATASFDGGSTFSQSGFGNAGFSQTGQGQPGQGHAGSGQGGANGATVSADAGASGGRSHQQTQSETTAISSVDGVGVLRDKVLPGRVSDAAAYGIHTELGGSEGSPSLGYGTGGGWLNVRA